MNLQPQYANNPFYTDIGDYECETATEMEVMPTSVAQATMESLTNTTSTAIDYRYGTAICIEYVESRRFIFV